MRFSTAAALFFLASLPAEAGSLQLTDGRHWVAVASTKDKDQAIGIARLYGANARVVSSTTGWLGIVLGPVKDKSLAAFKDAYQGWPAIPGDAVWSRGDKYVDTVWVPAEGVPQDVEFEEGKPATAELSGLKVTATLSKSDDNQTVRIVGEQGGRQVFDLSTPPDFYVEYGNSIRLAPLDPTTEAPEVMVTENTGGAHCCEQTWIASQAADGSWSLADMGALDGGGFWLENVDVDQSYELMSYDNAFLYAFDSYAGSFAPVVIEQFSGGKAKPYARNGVWLSRLRQDLAGMEYNAKLEPDIARSNGYLVAWVAEKILLGEGDEAWAKMMKTYDRNSDFGPQVCTSGESVDNCPVDNLKAVPFPEAVAEFLKENGYGPLPAAAQ